MNPTTNPILRPGHALAVVTAGVLTSIALLGPAFAAPGTTHAAVARAPSSHCHVVPANLPRTPDAAEALLTSCYERAVVSTPSRSGCQPDPAYLPRTPDAADAWLKNCHASPGHLAVTATSGSRMVTG